MAVITPAIGIQSGSHSAKSFRQLAAALVGESVETFVNSVGAVGPGHGLVRSGDLAVTQRGAGVNMSVDVAKGRAFITGSSSLAQGVYAFANDAVWNLVIATADATNPRRDIVVAQIRDNTEDAGGSNDARLFVVTGTPAASPADPAIPAGTLALARVAVAALAASISNANITTVAAVASDYTTWAPVVNFGGSATNLTLNLARYQQEGSRLWGELKVTFTGAPAAGNFGFTLPVNVASSAGGRTTIGQASLMDSGSNWAAATVITTSSSLGAVTLAHGAAHDLLRQAAPWTWAVNDELYLTFEYRF